MRQALVSAFTATSDTRWLPNPLRWGAGILLGVLCGFFLRISADNVGASHPKDRDADAPGLQHSHIKTINAPHLYEKWCHWPYGDMTHDDARQRIYNELSDVQGWRTVRWVDPVGGFLCDEDPNSVGPLETPHFEIYMYTAASLMDGAFCGADYPGCVVKDPVADFLPDPNATHIDPGFAQPREFRLVRMYLKTDALQNDATALMNHEMGHVLGLADWDGNPDDIKGDCDPEPTIMHCDALQFPTAADKASVRGLEPANQTGFGKAGFLA